MRISNKILVARLEGLGWNVEHHGYQYTYLRHPDGRSGELPGASKSMRDSFWPTHLWARIKRDLRLEGEEIHG